MADQELSPSSSSGGGVPRNRDRIDEIMEALEDPTLDNLPEHLRTFKYTEGFNPEKLEEELQSHPFFMSEMPDPTKPLPPLLDAFQQLKYSENENTNHELAINHKEDGLFHFKIKKYRIAATCFTNALSYEMKCAGDEGVDKELLANLYNNRSACSWFIANYRSCIKDCDEALKYKPGYGKVLRRAIMAAEKLKRWEEMEKYCLIGEEASGGGDTETLQFYIEKRGNAKRGKAMDEVRRRRMKIGENRKEAEKEVLLEQIRKRGIKAKDWKFLESEAAQNGRVVTFNPEMKDGETRLCWPVLFMYPQFGESDFVEAFEEEDSFAAQLYEMLDVSRPGWDIDNEYKLETVEIYYLGEKLVRIDVNSSLGNVLTKEWFALPTNGVPTFFVLCGNQFCKDFLERVDIF